MQKKETTNTNENNIKNSSSRKVILIKGIRLKTVLKDKKRSIK